MPRWNAELDSLHLHLITAHLLHSTNLSSQLPQDHPTLPLHFFCAACGVAACCTKAFVAEIQSARQEACGLYAACQFMPSRILYVERQRDDLGRGHTIRSCMSGSAEGRKAESKASLLPSTGVVSAGQISCQHRSKSEQKQKRNLNLSNPMITCSPGCPTVLMQADTLM